ncbi:SDR family NAD(P)-dependent oxidoreductase [Salsuginibacillus kocurii]|uniref:SDR family NAD(P)-dependent oxidoreductase n=1 Tax=Salsuginibacillus kocurii TaxID=427078 RepID=UPI00039CD0C6|nr:SDR family NAD(P)-dependent oxidoreductase [Salsuginibacillus kocurii]
MMLDELDELNRPVLLITGAAQGIGKETAILFLKAGYRVLAGVRKIENSDSLLETAEQEGVGAQLVIFKLDVTNHAEVENDLPERLQKAGRLDVLIHNAGYAAAGFLETLSLDDWKKQYDVNVFGAVAVTKAALPWMYKSACPLILFVSSISSITPFPGLSAYASSKAAVDTVAESLHFELETRNINVRSFQFGSFKTAIWERGIQENQLGSQPTQYAQIIEQKLRERVSKQQSNFEEPQKAAAQLLKAAKKPCKPRLHQTFGGNSRLLQFLKWLLPWQAWRRAVLRNLNK